jgi:hypothetical protein
MNFGVDAGSLGMKMLKVIVNCFESNQASRIIDHENSPLLPCAYMDLVTKESRAFRFFPAGMSVI